MNEAGSLVRAASQWLLGVLLAVVLMGLFIAAAGVQVTSAGAGQRLLRRAVAVSTQIDALLPDLQEGLQRAAASDAERVQVPDFPVPVEIPRQEALRISPGELRSRLLDEAARRLYADGMSVWAAADPQAHRQVETISTAGAYQHGLGLISDESHTRLIIATAVLGALAALLALLLVFSVRSYARLAALGAAVMGAALPLLAAAVAVRFGLKTAQEEADPFVDGLLAIGVDTMWVPIRDYLALTALGFAVAAVAAFSLWWRDRGGARLPSGSQDAS